jgi:Arc/MetJ-type ribon-helix-helix transcriptional regulator
MGKVTVYVPDPLLARLERLRARGQDLNMSEVCRLALERAIAVREAAIQGDVGARVAERLKATENRSAAARHAGAAEGRRWAEDVGNWGDIQRVVAWNLNRIEVVEVVDQDHESASFVGMSIGHEGSELEWPAGAARPEDGLSAPDRFRRDLCEQYLRGFQAAVDSVYTLVLPAMEPDGTPA